MKVAKLTAHDRSEYAGVRAFDRFQQYVFERTGVDVQQDYKLLFLFRLATQGHPPLRDPDGVARAVLLLVRECLPVLTAPVGG